MDGTIPLRDCLSKYEVDNEAYCSYCKQISLKKYQISIAKLSPVLILLLPKSAQTTIEFPLTDLDLGEFIPDSDPGEYIYDLYATVILAQKQCFVLQFI